jgi:hypothetical protein
MIYIVPVSVMRQFSATFICAFVGLVAMIGATETNRLGWQMILGTVAILLWLASISAAVNGCRLAAAKLRTVFWWGR